MVWNNPPKFVPAAPKKGKLITPEMLAASGSEDGHQAGLFCWAAGSVGKYPQLKWLHSIPNGGSRHIVEAGKIVAAGARSGVLDMFLPCPTKMSYFDGDIFGYCGCYIEMKKANRRNHKNGGLEDDQVEFKEYAEAAGYYVAVCYSWQEARNVLISYLEGKL